MKSKATIVFGLVGALAGVGLAFWLNREQLQAPIQPPPIPQQNNGKLQNFKPSLYGLNSQANSLQTVTLSIAAESPEAALRISLERLLAGLPELSSEIPAKTKLLDLKLKDRELTLDLSQEFTSGGGSASMTRRLAQVLYTATSLDPEARLYLLVEGKPLKNLGGEGLEVLQPVTRKDVSNQF